jgi:hypothetical protein
VSNTNGEGPSRGTANARILHEVDNTPPLDYTQRQELWEKAKERQERSSKNQKRFENNSHEPGTIKYKWILPDDMIHLYKLFEGTNKGMNKGTNVLVMRDKIQELGRGHHSFQLE